MHEVLKYVEVRALKRKMMEYDGIWLRVGHLGGEAGSSTFNFWFCIRCTRIAWNSDAWTGRQVNWWKVGWLDFVALGRSAGTVVTVIRKAWMDLDGGS